MSVDTVEWMVGHRDELNQMITAMEGAQSVFSKSAAEKMVRKLGAPWGVIHMTTHLAPEEHEQWLALNQKAHGTEPTWGSRWEA